MQVRLITFAGFCLVFLSCISRKIGVNPPLKMAGQYKEAKGDEILIFNDDNTFVCLRNNHQKSDAVVSRCDTLAAGNWNQRKTFISLKNNINYNKIEYSIVESEFNSKDSLYFKIILPQEDALDYDIFKFALITSPMYGHFNESSKSEFAISKKGDGVAFNLIIKNIGPNCDFGKKCYQRIYFNVFEGYRPKKSRSNFFTITINNFTQCFYEAMDLDGEIIGIESDKLYWKGNIYEKIN